VSVSSSSISPPGASLAKQKVLITGGLGFIGSNLARRLVDLGAEVAIVDPLLPNYGAAWFNLEGYDQRIEIRVGDMADRAIVGDLAARAAVIFNLAGHTSHLDSMRDPVHDLAVNCAAQLHFLELCRGGVGAKIVFASTRQIYGRPQQLPTPETHPLVPVDINGVHKVAGESYHRLYAELHGLRAVSLRLTNTYGPRMRIKDARQTFLGVWIRLALEGRPFEVWGGTQLRDFSYVDDVVDALLIAAEEPKTAGGVFNLSGEPVLSLAAVAEQLSAMTGGGYEVKAFPEERKAIDIGDYYADDGLFRSVTGWRSRIRFDEGLERTLAYYREHLARYV
jgi:UDP-glucose 4-epimerase